MQFLCLINGTPANVKTENMKFRVDGDECAIVGSWHNGKPYRPNREQFRAALPYRWRAAFDREQAFWHSKEGGAEQCKISLSDARGRYLATIYCQPVQELLNPQEVFDLLGRCAARCADV